MISQLSNITSQLFSTSSSRIISTATPQHEVDRLRGITPSKLFKHTDNFQGIINDSTEIQFIKPVIRCNINSSTRFCCPSREAFQSLYLFASVSLAILLFALYTGASFPFSIIIHASHAICQRCRDHFYLLDCRFIKFCPDVLSDCNVHMHFYSPSRKIIFIDSCGDIASRNFS